MSRRRRSNKPYRSKRTSKSIIILREVNIFAFYIVFVGIAIFLMIHFVGQRSVVHGSSMDYTLADGQSLITEKISYRFHDPERYDIVVFPGPKEADGTTPNYIKRIVGLPGETVQIKEGKVYINGDELESDVYSIDGRTEANDLNANGVTLQEDEYFCLGDNRPVSKDCRTTEVGLVTRNMIKGKVWIRIWPLDQFGFVENGNLEANQYIWK